MASAFFLVGNDLLCHFQLPMPPERTFGALAYFCPQCGEVWARMVVQGRKFYPVYAHCTAHGSGTLLHPVACSDIEQFFPHEVWLREVQLIAADERLW